MERSRRASAVVWGALAAVCLGGALLVWVVSPTGTGVTLFGPRWVAAGLVVAALPATVVAAAAALTGARRSRRLLVIAVSALAGAMGALAAGSLFAAQVFGDAVAGILLAVAAIAMYVLAQQVLRIGKETR